MLKRDFSDIVYRALANYFDVHVINSNIKRTGKKIKLIDVSSSTTVSAGNYEVIEVKPPDGKVWKIKNFRVSIKPPSGATSGTHDLRVHVISPFSAVPYISSGYNENIGIGDGILVNGSHTGGLSPYEFFKWLTSLEFTSSKPLYIAYYNNTDADQTETRTIQLIIEEFDEVS